MPTADLGPAATNVAKVLAGITDEQLAAPTPCPRYTVGDLLDHVGGLSLAFTAAASKSPMAAAGPDAPLGDAGHLDAAWRETIPAALDELAAAWRDDAAWEGTTTAGPIEMPGGHRRDGGARGAGRARLGPGPRHRPALRRRRAPRSSSSVASSPTSPPPTTRAPW